MLRLLNPKVGGLGLHGNAVEEQQQQQTAGCQLWGLKRIHSRITPGQHLYTDYTIQYFSFHQVLIIAGSARTVEREVCPTLLHIIGHTDGTFCVISTQYYNLL